MQDLISKLQQHVEAGMKNYQSLIGNEKISSRRTQDIVNIRKILYDPRHDFDFKLKTIKKYLSHLKTGWGFFHTGRSQLKNLILYEMKFFKANSVNNTQMWGCWCVRGLIHHVRHHEVSESEFSSKLFRILMMVTVIWSLVFIA